MPCRGSGHSRTTGSPLAISRTRNGHLNHPVVNRARNARWPTRGDPHGHGASVVVRGRESRPHGEGRQVSPDVWAVLGKRVMRKADLILDIHHNHAVAVETNWRAGCGESRKSGSEGGGWKRAARCST